MIVNTALGSPFRQDSKIPLGWQRLLTTWVTLLLGEDFNAVFDLQLRMVQAILELESSIKDLRTRSAALRIGLKELKRSAGLDEVRKRQREADQLRNEAETLSYLRQCILFLGDLIAYRMLHIDSFKLFSANQMSGFLSQKSGLQAELDAARHFYSRGYIVLINDLTTCVRIGDLTLRKDGKTSTFEVKSSPSGYLAHESIRQILEPVLIHNLMDTDIMPVTPIVRIPAPIVRLDSDLEEIWHHSVPGELISASRRTGIGHLQKGGKHYFGAWRSEIEGLRELVGRVTDQGNWVVENFQRRVRAHPEVPPFFRWFKAATSIDILSGDYVILTAFSLEELAEMFSTRGVSMDWKRKGECGLHIALSSPFAIKHGFEIVGELGLSQRFRVMLSFLALETYSDICAFLLSEPAFRQHYEKTKGLPKPPPGSG